jgi:enoyl-CoA hydratase/carnithine racemase
VLDVVIAAPPMNLLGPELVRDLVALIHEVEAELSADDYGAELAERYGWINRAVPAAELDSFAHKLAHRIAAFPAVGHVAIKSRVNAISLAPAEEFRHDSDAFGESVRSSDTRQRIQAALSNGFQNRDTKLQLGRPGR